jgi:hypothetical protein
MGAVFIRPGIYSRQAANRFDIDPFPVPFFPAGDHPLLCTAFFEPGQEAGNVVCDPVLPFTRLRRHTPWSGIPGDKREAAGE